MQIPKTSDLLNIVTPCTAAALPELALFDVTGANASAFLQGQLTQDVNTWQPNEIKRAAWCNAKGRMLVTFYLWQIEGGFRFIMARDLVTKILPRLRMFVMRAKVTVSEPLPLPMYACINQNIDLTTPLQHDERTFTLLNDYAVTFNDALTPSSIDWTSAHTQAGVVWISAANSEQFVPQTTNFELVGGVSFRKGCYPGQEIVARSQYLGKLKLRAAIAQCDEVEIAPQMVPQDVFEAGSNNPVGRVIQASKGWVLFEAPQVLIESGVTMHLGSPSGTPLHVQALPYPVLDITA